MDVKSNGADGNELPSAVNKIHTGGVFINATVAVLWLIFYVVLQERSSRISHIRWEKNNKCNGSNTYRKVHQKGKLTTLTEVIRLFYSGNIARMYGWARYVLRKSGPFRTRLLSVPSPQHAIARQTTHCIGRNVTKPQSRHNHLHQQNYNVETSEVIIRTWALVYT